MEKEKKTINNAQRKALAQLVERTYDRLIQEAKNKEEVLVKETTEKVKAELGADTIENQIDALEKQVKTLEGNMEQLGFSPYGDAIWGSKAKMLVDTRAHQESIKLEKERAEKLAGIWIVQTLDEAKAFLKGIVQ